MGGTSPSGVLGGESSWGQAREHAEARRQLLGMARMKTGAIPAELVADLVNALHREVRSGPRWPVVKRAMEEVLARIRDASKLSVHTRPAGGVLLGGYRVQEAGELLPVRCAIVAVEPFRASCDCPDFTRASLGVCEHVLAVIADMQSRARWKRALKKQSRPAVDTVYWDPARPLSGDGDWVDQVRLIAGAERSRAVRKLFDEHTLSRARTVSRDDFVLGLASVLECRPVLASFNPALWSLVAEERPRVRHRRQSAVGPAIDALKVPLFDHQRVGVERLFEHGHLLIADQMGIGKTAQAIAACHAAVELDRARRGLVIVPTSLKDQWQMEWQRFSDLPIVRVEGNRSERHGAFRRLGEAFVLIGYAQLRNDIEAIRAWDPQMVVLDEAQRIKNAHTATRKKLCTLRPSIRLALTGTPIENRLTELASVVGWVDDRALEPRWRMEAWHDRRDERGEKNGTKDLETIRARIAPCTVRRKYADIRSELPKRVDKMISVVMTPQQRSWHDSYNKWIKLILAILDYRRLNRAEFLNLMQYFTAQRVLANGVAQREFDSVWPALRERSPTETIGQLDSPKLVEFRRLAQREAIEGEHKLVVFSQWTKMIKLARWSVSDLFSEHGLRVAFFTGEESPRRRRMSLVRFHDEPETRILFCTDAGGVGLNLQHAASRVVNLELPWNPAVREQRIARVHRFGQQRPVEVTELTAGGSIEDRIGGRLWFKQRLFDAVFDREDDEIDLNPKNLWLNNFVDMEDLSEPAV